MNNFPYDAVVFDLDGTLFDAEEGIVSSVIESVRGLGLEVPQNADLREVVGPPLRDSYRRLLNVPEELVEKAMDLYRVDFSARGMYLYSVYPHIRSILQMLRKGGTHVAVATSKPLWLALDILRHFGMEKLFDRVVGEVDGAAKLGKPELIRSALPDKYKSAAMVGDRTFDVEGALANGIDAVAVSYGCGSEEELQDAGATVIIPDTESLRAYLCPGAEIPRGFFLTVEGPDGSGKTTQVDLLEKRLKQFGFTVTRTREPGASTVSAWCAPVSPAAARSARTSAASFWTPKTWKCATSARRCSMPHPARSMCIKSSAPRWSAANWCCATDLWTARSPIREADASWAWT